jgi:hypothetical protein
MQDVDRKAWRALFAAQLGWMLDAMDFLLFTFALLSIQKEFALTKQQISIPISVALIASLRENVHQPSPSADPG